MEFIKDFIEQKLSINERVKLIKALMDVDMVYEDIKTHILDNMEMEE